MSKCWALWEDEDCGHASIAWWKLSTPHQLFKLLSAHLTLAFDVLPIMRAIVLLGLGMCTSFAIDSVYELVDADVSLRPVKFITLSK